MKHIPEPIYQEIISILPIICVDGFIINNEGKLLLMKRSNWPAIGQWWVSGGRVIKNESLSEAIVRKVKEETNLDVTIVANAGYTETIFENKHTVNICFVLMSTTTDIKLNSEHSEYEWFDFDKLPEGLHPVLLGKINSL